MKIFYFTGTGNSLAVAKRLSGELVSIPQVMKERSFVFEDEAIGIIFPLYCLNPSKMVREFLSKAKFHTEYLFAVANYGNLAGASMQELQKSLKLYGYQFHYMNTLLIVDNFLPNFEINEEISLMKKKKKGRMSGKDRSGYPQSQTLHSKTDAKRYRPFCGVLFANGTAG